MLKNSYQYSTIFTGRDKNIIESLMKIEQPEKEKAIEQLKVVHFGIVINNGFDTLGYILMTISPKRTILSIIDMYYTEEKIIYNLLDRVVNFGVKNKISIFEMQYYTDELIPLLEEYGFTITNTYKNKDKIKYELFLYIDINEYIENKDNRTIDELIKYIIEDDSESDEDENYSEDEDNKEYHLEDNKYHLKEEYHLEDNEYYSEDEDNN